ncbi:MAG: hypothetical protein O3C40_32660 [Planctomycetota bacterium]|nr:hypothetical protein [Planctomycetota bacterium]
MAKRKPKEQKQPAADLAALGERLANAAKTAHDRLAYWWNELHPNRQPVTVDIQIVDATVVPIKSRDVPPTPDELRQYFVARLGYSLVDYEAMNVAAVVEVLRREAKKSKSRVIPPEYRTIPMSYQRAAELMGRGKSKDAAEWLSKSVEDGSIACERITRQAHVFDCRDFDKSVWPRIKVGGPTHPKWP